MTQVPRFKGHKKYSPAQKKAVSYSIFCAFEGNSPELKKKKKK